MESNILVAQRVDAFNGNSLNTELSISEKLGVFGKLNSRIQILLTDVSLPYMDKSYFEEHSDVLSLYIAYGTWKTENVIADFGEIFEEQTSNANAFIDAGDNVITREIVEKFYQEQIDADEMPENSDLEKFVLAALDVPAIYYDINHRDGVKISKLADCAEYIHALNEKMYPLYPEQMDVPEELRGEARYVKWVKAALSLDETPFEGMSPKDAFIDIWTEDGKIADENSETLPAITKRKLDTFICDKIVQNGRVGFTEIMEFLRQSPFGLTGNRLSSYYMALLLRSYMNDDYCWSDGLISGPMNAEYMKTAILNQMKTFYRKIPSRREDYIVRRDNSVDSFIELSRDLFEIDEEASLIEQLRLLLRYKLTELPYPLWAIRSKTDDDSIKKLIDGYIKLVRNDYDNNQSDWTTIKEIIEILDKNVELKVKMKEYLHSEELESEWKETLEKVSSSPVTSEWKWIWDEEILLLLR